MKLATALTDDGRVVAGPVIDDELIDVSTSVGSMVQLLDPDRRGDIEAAIPDATRHSLDLLHWLPPVTEPRRILCIGVNYATHAAESDRAPTGQEHPVVFTRFASSLVGNEQPIIRPHVSTAFDWEGELAVVIGRRARHVAATDAHHVIGGWSCFMDGTLRDYQRHTSQFIHGKNFDRSGSFGPWIVTPDELPDATSLDIATTVNGEQMQHASTSDLIHPIDRLIAYCSTFTTLEPGDVIATGTPGGVGYARTPPIFLVPGDVVEVIIEGVGTLRNTVIDEAALNG
jgi:2-keto-4-pentenoate hydratase/2-oxohepta-3-ene-1,7-dioic acid hydratase in catechol pathway